MFYYFFAVFVIVGTVNAVNITDGVDGLATGTSIPVFLFFVLVTFAWGREYLQLGLFASAMVGGLLGFLRYNSHPARVFMGDVGSFFIGGALAGMTTVTQLSLLLPIIALAMLLSSLSDLIQFAYFRATHGKRFFRMAPLHHHFELGGTPETKIVSMYTIVTAIASGCALLIFWLCK